MEPFKNLLGIEAAKKIAKAFERADRSFKRDLFLKGLSSELEPLELKGRMLLLKDRLVRQLPDDPRRGFPLLVEMLKTQERDSVGLESFLVWPLTQVVAEKGLGHFEESMKALHRMTQVSTAEFAVRPFFVHSEAATLKQFSQWIEDPNEHVRRLVSEGSRPLLPWGQRLPSFVKDPKKTWALIEPLRHDSAEYVRKSVANHINDHSKHHGDWVVQNLKRWKKESDPSPQQLEWIIRHATRTLVKQGHLGALALHGVGGSKIKLLSQKILTPRVRLGEKLRVLVGIQNLEARSARVIFDQELGLLKANGTHSAKVFKGRKLELAPHEKLQLEMELPIRQVTTRVYYFGTQFWTPILNGMKGRALEFELQKGR